MSSEQFPRITEAGLDALRKMIGVPITDTVEPWCYEVTRDNIRHYAHGIGDDNPLWCDPEYAKRTRFGRLVAPPSFVFPLNRILSGYVGGLPGIHAMWSGADIQWHHPLLVGMQIRCEAYLKELVEHETRFAGRAIQQIYHVTTSIRTTSTWPAPTPGASAPSATRRATRGRSTAPPSRSRRPTAGRPSRRSSRATRPRRSAAPSRATWRTSRSATRCRRW